MPTTPMESMGDELVPLIEERMKRHETMGLSIALVDGDQPVWAEGFGFADRENYVPATADTVFKAGSITKLFTATAAMQLVEQGRLDLDQPVQSYVPEFSYKSRYPVDPPVTVRTLMTHHSGLPCDNQRHSYARQADTDPEPFQSVLEFLRHRYAAYPPNHIFSYSNLAIDLLGVVIERVSGEAYQDYVDLHILKPLGMEHSSIGLNETTRPRLAKGYSGQVGTREPLMRDAPAGGLHTTALDLSRFAAMVIGGGSRNGIQLLRPETLAQMLTCQNRAVPLDFDLQIGLNWLLSRPSLHYAGHVCWHDGGTWHFCSNLVVLPDHKLGVAILCNSESAAPLVAQLADEVLKRALALTRGIEPVASESTDAPPSAALSPEPLRELVGEYPTVPLGMVSFQAGDEGLFVTMKDKTLELVPQSDGWLAFKEPIGPLRLAFRCIDGHAVLAVEQEGLRVVMGRRHHRRAIPGRWRKLAGSYRNTEVDDPTVQNAELKWAEDLLWLEATFRKVGQVRVFMEPISDNEALTLGLGRFANETVHVREIDGVEHLELWGHLLRKD
jgi:CubicO group peptidase (beta-lactamase class C family)